MLIEHEQDELYQDELYLKANRRRWRLGEYLVRQYPNLVLLPIYPYFHKDEAKRGKVPCIRWKDRTQTSLRDIQDWKYRDDGFCNLGLVLGVKSGGILGIDVDGSGGRDILKELSGGDLPLTVAYKTPGGGLRYLYLYPEKYRERVFKKQTKNGDGEHNGVEILADGQQTVLPWSIHPNGGIYRFLKGQSFQKVEIAEAPQWVMDILLRKKTMTQRVIVRPNAQSITSVSVEPLITDSECRKLHELLEVQKSPDSLDETSWFHSIAFLTSAGFPDAASEFSQLSSKHDDRSEERLSSLAQQENKGTIRCVTFGCTEDDVSRCFSKLHYNSNGELINSPAVKLASWTRAISGRKGMIDYPSIGLNLDEEGNFYSLNPNKFVRHFLETTNLRVFDGRRSDDCRYYVYENNHWNEMS